MDTLFLTPPTLFSEMVMIMCTSWTKSSVPAALFVFAVVLSVGCEPLHRDIDTVDQPDADTPAHDTGAVPEDTEPTPPGAGGDGGFAGGGGGAGPNRSGGDHDTAGQAGFGAGDGGGAGIGGALFHRSGQTTIDDTSHFYENTSSGGPGGDAYHPGSRGHDAQGIAPDIFLYSGSVDCPSSCDDLIIEY